MNILEKIELKIIEMIDVHQQLIEKIQQLESQNSQLISQLEQSELEKEIIQERLEKIFSTIHEVQEVVSQQEIDEMLSIES